jgi:hypothetical protein
LNDKLEIASRTEAKKIGERIHELQAAKNKVMKDIEKIEE